MNFRNKRNIDRYNVGLWNPGRARGIAARKGFAVLLVLGVLSVTLAVAYSLSRSTVTTSALAFRERGGLAAKSAVETSVIPPFVNLRTNPNWMPDDSPIRGSLVDDEQYQVSLEMSDEGTGRLLEAQAEVFDRPANPAHYSESQASRPLAMQQLKIELARQARSDLPTAAITAFRSSVSERFGPPVYIESGNTVRGNVRSRGPVYFQEGFSLEGTARRMGDVSRRGTDSINYVTYRASWGTTYKAESLADKHGWSVGNKRISLRNVVLGPSETNPMGVFYFSGNEVVLDENVSITGTLVTSGDVTIRGPGVHIIALQKQQIPGNDSGGSTSPTSNDPTGFATGTTQFISGNPVTTYAKRRLEPVPVITAATPLEFKATKPANAAEWVNTSFPAIVADRRIMVDGRADEVRISGVVLAGISFRRLSTSSSSKCDHDHTKPLNELTNPLATSDGPAVYIRGAIMAGRVSLSNQAGRPFAIEFNKDVTNVVDAPGFFTWRVREWTAAY